jgi:hypothetical protein
MTPAVSPSLYSTLSSRAERRSGWLSASFQNEKPQLVGSPACRSLPLKMSLDGEGIVCAIIEIKSGKV